METMLDGTGAISAPRIAAGRRRQDPRLQALLGLAAVLAVLAGAGWAASRAGPDAGPLAVGETGSGWSFGPVLRGQWAVTTLFTNRLAGIAPAFIDSVSPATRPRIPGTTILPLRGAVVRPGREAAIVVGVAARSLGRRRVTAFTVRYHVGRVHYEATFGTGIERSVSLPLSWPTGV